MKDINSLLKTVGNYKKGAGYGTEFMDVCIIAERALEELNKPTTIASAPKQPRANKKDKEVKEQEHEEHCYLWVTPFKIRTEFTCNCDKRKRFKSEFKERRK